MAWARSASRFRLATASALVVLVCAAIVVFIPRPDAEVRVADVGLEYATARSRAPYVVALPTELPPGWRVTDASFFTHRETSRWHLGLVTPSGEHAGIDQVDGLRPQFIGLVTGSGQTPDREVTIKGLTWGMRLVEDRDLRSLALERADSVVVISGKGEFPELIELARALAATLTSGVPT